MVAAPLHYQDDLIGAWSWPAADLIRRPRTPRASAQAPGGAAPDSPMAVRRWRRLKLHGRASRPPHQGERQPPSTPRCSGASAARGARRASGETAAARTARTPSPWHQATIVFARRAPALQRSPTSAARRRSGALVHSGRTCSTQLGHRRRRRLARPLQGAHPRPAGARPSFGHRIDKHVGARSSGACSAGRQTVRIVAFTARATIEHTCSTTSADLRPRRCARASTRTGGALDPTAGHRLRASGKAVRGERHRARSTTIVRLPRPPGAGRPGHARALLRGNRRRTASNYQIYAGASRCSRDGADSAPCLPAATCACGSSCSPCGIALRARIGSAGAAAGARSRRANLVLVQHTPLSIRFRFDEKRLRRRTARVRHPLRDRQKRIDKAVVRGTAERLTQPGKIAIVYAHNAEAAEYRHYPSTTLQKLGYLTTDVGRRARPRRAAGRPDLRALQATVDLGASR